MAQKRFRLISIFASYWWVKPKFHPTLIVVQMCGMFVLEDSKSIVEMLVKQGKDRAAMEEQLAW